MSAFAAVSEPGMHMVGTPRGWAPTPFREFVLKVHANCNLKCSYCYMYEMADRSLPLGEVVMSPRVFEKVCERIASHAIEHKPPWVRVVLHGGEPLMARAALPGMARQLRQALRPFDLEIAVQTNGVMLNPATIDVLAAEEVMIGVSLDGDRRANDRHRRYANGRSSFPVVHRSLELLRSRPEVFAGILCVVDVRNDPLETYEALLAYQPPRIDFLLPHANWDSPPPLYERAPSYGDWLISIFERWYSAPVRETRIRLFEELINLILGGQSRTEVVGLSPVATIVVNTDGSYEQIDTLRSAYPGAVQTGLNVFQHPLNEALTHPAIVQRQIGVAALADECRSCPVHLVCGGGYYPHRYGRGAGFANPSIYCSDLMQLIDHMAARLRSDVVTLQRKRQLNSTHRLSEPAFDSLAAGLGDAAVVRDLRAAQVTWRKLQLRLLLDAVKSPTLTEPFALLAQAAMRAPDEARLLSLPHFGAWLATASRLVQDAGGDRKEEDAWFGYLGWLAATAAIQSGMDFEIDVATRDGVVMLPTIGRVSTVDSRVTISQRDGRIRVGRITVPDQPEQDAPGWHGLRTLTSEVDGLVLRVCLDDLDPFRENAVHPAASRLAARDVRVWQRLLDSAWPILVRHHGHYAEGIAEGLHTLVPLHTVRRTLGVNVTNKDAFGSVSMTTPANGEALAVGLVHEFQHAKLYALGDMVKLHEYDPRKRFYAPWRDDPRPLGAALQGVYAFLGVTDFWRVQRQVLDPTRARHADVEFARWRDRIRLTTSALMACSQFTPMGERFLAGLWARQESWQPEPVSAEAAELANEASEDHWVGWRLRNHVPDKTIVADLAHRWQQGLSCPDGAVPVAIAPSDQALLSSSARLDLSRLRITDPPRFAALCSTPEQLAKELPEASDGDLALARRDFGAATQSYRAQIVATASGLGPWIGLTLASRRGTAPAGALAEFPELCLAVQRQLTGSGDQVPDPIALAQWLAVRSVAAPSRS